MEGYSKIIRWEVWNFMSIAHAVCEFDEKNIVNLKGYNDSGKSAMLTALKVCLTNSNPTKQVEFITDDKDYFRVLVIFDDDVRLLRDKYRNGQSLYEMYKGDDLLFSTKSKSGALTKVSAVPEPIKQYLGLIDYENTYLNFRSCFEKQIGVQTTGSENYKMFNTVLKSEEIAKASSFLNTDKNKLLSDINSVDAEIKANQAIKGVGQFLSQEEIDYLKEHDNNIDEYDAMEQKVNNINKLDSQIKNIVITPKLNIIASSDLSELIHIVNLVANISSINITPELNIIDSDELNDLKEISEILKKIDSILVTPEINKVDENQLIDIIKLCQGASAYNEIKVAPEINKIDDKQLVTLNTINNIIDDLANCNSNISEIDNRLEVLNKEVDKLQKQSVEAGVNMVRCPNCGEVFNPDMEHVH